MNKSKFGFFTYVVRYIDIGIVEVENQRSRYVTAHSPLYIHKVYSGIYVVVIALHRFLVPCWE
jgi:hypothetical protein